MIAKKITSAYSTIIDRGPWVLCKAVSRLTAAQIEASTTGRRFIKRRIFDFEMILDRQDAGLSRSLLLFRARELDHKVMLEKIVSPGMTIFDIGGNIGYYPLMQLGLLNGTGKLIVIEPSPGNVDLLRQNLQLNGYSDVPIIAAAVSDTAGERDFHLSSQSNLGTFHPIGSGSETLTGETVEVTTTTVPRLADEYGSPDLIRMDVEGHEVEVIDGLLGDVKSGRYAPMIIFETHLTRYGAEHDMASTLTRLFDLGYYVPLLSSSTDVSARSLKDKGYSPGQRIATDGIHRTLFENVSNEDVVEIITKSGGARTVLLAPKPV